MQTCAEAEAKQADIRSKHLQKQLAEQQRGLHGMEREAVKLQKDLAHEEAAVQACQSRCLLYHELLVSCFWDCSFVRSCCTLSKSFTRSC